MMFGQRASAASSASSTFSAAGAVPCPSSLPSWSKQAVVQRSLCEVRYTFARYIVRKTRFQLFQVVERGGHGNASARTALHRIRPAVGGRNLMRPPTFRRSVRCWPAYGCSVAHDLCESPPEHAVALARSGLQCLAISDHDLPVPVPDAPCCLQVRRRKRDAGAPYPEHLG